MEKQLENEVFKQMEENNKKFNEFIDSELKRMKEKEIRESINKLNKHLSDVLLNDKLIPNPKYMVEPNNRELMWSEDDTHLYNLLENRIQCLEEELKTIKN